MEIILIVFDLVKDLWVLIKNYSESPDSKFVPFAQPGIFSTQG